MYTEIVKGNLCDCQYRCDENPKILERYILYDDAAIYKGEVSYAPPIVPRKTRYTAARSKSDAKAKPQYIFGNAIHIAKCADEETEVIINHPLEYSI